MYYITCLRSEVCAGLSPKPCQGTLKNSTMFELLGRTCFVPLELLLSVVPHRTLLNFGKGWWAAIVLLVMPSVVMVRYGLARLTRRVSSLQRSYMVISAMGSVTLDKMGLRLRQCIPQSSAGRSLEVSFSMDSVSSLHN